MRREEGGERDEALRKTGLFREEREIGKERGMKH